MKYWSGEAITELKEDYIFVFGSNPEGRHGAGAAKQAVKFGAVCGKGRGLYGNTYALPTKNLKKGYVEKLANGKTIEYNKSGYKSLSKEQIKDNIEEFYDCCNENKDLKFFIAYKNNAGNLNGYSSLEMFNMFTEGFEVPDNVYFHNSFRSI